MISFDLVGEIKPGVEKDRGYLICAKGDEGDDSAEVADEGCNENGKLLA